MSDSVEKYMVGDIEVEVTDEGVQVEGVFLPHNEHIWRRATNRHTTTRGNSWGWVTYGDGGVIVEGWSNDSGHKFTGEMASIAIAAHNKWIDNIQPVQIKLIKARRKLNLAEGNLYVMEAKYNKAKGEYEKAQTELQSILQETEE